MGAALEHHRVAGQQLSRPQQETRRPPRTSSAGTSSTSHPPSGGPPGGRRLQLSHRLRGSPLGITLECLAAGLHEDHDQTGERLPQNQGGDDGQHGHQIRGKAARGDAAQGLPHHRRTGERQPRAPQQ